MTRDSHPEACGCISRRHARATCGPCIDGRHDSCSADQHQSETRCPRLPVVIHTTELIERHRFTILAKDLPTGAAARSEAARLHAEAYARARGWDITDRILIISGSGAPAGVPGSEAYNGVEFEMVMLCR